MIVLTLVTAVINFIVGWYILFTIPKRLRLISNKLDMVTKNQTIIEKKINQK